MDMMKSLILLMVITVAWAQYYVRNDGTPIVFGVGRDGDPNLAKSQSELVMSPSSSRRSPGPTSLGQQSGEVSFSDQTSQGSRPGKVFSSSQVSERQQSRLVFSSSQVTQDQQPGSLFHSSQFSSIFTQQTILPQNRYCDHAGRPVVDEVFQGRAYHFSWCHDGGRSYTWNDASYHCQRLGNGFQAISIEHPNEDSFVAGVMRTYQIRDIWTSGSTHGYNQWSWQSGVSTGYTNWSNTGRLGRSQPDNADGNEQCLAVVNAFGTGWHDSLCNTLRPVICETQEYYRQ